MWDWLGPSAFPGVHLRDIFVAALQVSGPEIFPSLLPVRRSFPQKSNAQNTGSHVCVDARARVSASEPSTLCVTVSLVVLRTWILAGSKSRLRLRLSTLERVRILGAARAGTEAFVQRADGIVRVDSKAAFSKGEKICTFHKGRRVLVTIYTVALSPTSLCP